MPIYEYECQSCHKVFEYMQRMSEDAKTVCEECEGALQRIISQSAFHLKGGGWYKDLYSSTKKDGDSKESTSSESASQDASSSSSDAPKSSDASTKSAGDTPKVSSDASAKPEPAKAKATSKE